MVIRDQFYSRNRLARDTGISLAFASYIYSGARVPSARTLRRIARRLGVEVGEVVRALPRASRRLAADRVTPKKWVRVPVSSPGRDRTRYSRAGEGKAEPTAIGL